ncbi:MAG: sulfate adenylyltransferase, partial [Candidatus Omnitrophica bacterium]|nr:sulfate adenylyltransferase [Candidatus Omnitrophota bacterium]
INLSHTKLEDIERVVDEIRAYTNVAICLDTEGAQVRTGDLAEGKVKVEENSIIKILNYPVAGNAETFNLYPCNIVRELEIGDLVSIDFNSVLVQIIENIPDGVLARVLTGGLLGQNKAVTVDRDLRMPPLTEKDQAILKIGLQMGITHVALSFANKGEDVDFIRSIVGDDVFLISKIESINGIENLRGIAGRSNAILLDRGDLSREVPIEQIPRAQKEMIRRGKECGAKVYVATNLLESMITDANPTRAEVNDVFNTLVDGADGLVLAAETAIGSHPVQCAMMVSKIIQQFSEFDNGSKFSTKYLKQRNSMLLVEPHGGKLVNRLCSGPDWDEINQLKKLSVDITVLMNAEQIALGTYSPIEGFMTKEELESVIHDYALPNSVVWPLPITLQLQKGHGVPNTAGERIALCLDSTGEIHAILEISEVYSYDVEKIAR